MAKYNLHLSSYVESSDTLQVHDAGNTAVRITENILVWQVEDTDNSIGIS